MIRKQDVEERAEIDEDVDKLWRMAVIVQIIVFVVLAPSIIVPIAFTTHLIITHETSVIVALTPLTALAFPAAVIVLFRKMNQ